MMVTKAVVKGIGIGILTLLTAEGACVTKNVLELDHMASLEQRITPGDVKQAVHLKAMLDGPLEDFSEMEILDNLVPSESMFLALAFYSYGLTNMALSDEEHRDFAKKYIERAIQKATRPRIFHAFSADLTEESHENVLYLGHLNLMMGAYALVSDNGKYLSTQKMITDALTRNFLASPTHHLQTYKGHRWPADNVVALASIALYDHLAGEDHSQAIDAWKMWTKQHLDENRLLYSHINDETYLPDEEARGCAIAFSIPFISMFDRPFADQLYKDFRRTFFKEFMGIPFARESLQDNYLANVDSGPIIMDMGTVASAFSIGAAKVAGDKETFSRLSKAAEIFTLPYETFDGKGYLANVSLGEAVLLYGRTLRQWF